jgi:hypothetical protein
MDINYLQLKPGATLPDISSLKPFLAIVVIEESVEPAWREKVSHWLVDSGCRYLMSWGADKSAWDEAVDLANIAQFNRGDIPMDEMVLSVEHGNGALEQFFKEAKATVMQDCADFNNSILLHIFRENKEKEYLTLYSRA